MADAQPRETLHWAVIHNIRKVLGSFSTMDHNLLQLDPSSAYQKVKTPTPTNRLKILFSAEDYEEWSPTTRSEECVVTKGKIPPDTYKMMTRHYY